MSAERSNRKSTLSAVVPASTGKKISGWQSPVAGPLLPTGAAVPAVPTVAGGVVAPLPPAPVGLSGGAAAPAAATGPPALGAAEVGVPPGKSVGGVVLVGAAIGVEA